VLESWSEREYSTIAAPERGGEHGFLSRVIDANDRRERTMSSRASSRTSIPALDERPATGFERKGAGNARGLPVEIAVEQKLGYLLEGEIEEKIGSEDFKRGCRESVFAYLESGTGRTERGSALLELDHATGAGRDIHRVGVFFVVGASAD